MILRAAGRRRIPWKNGGGEAEDIASGPPGADWSTMDWRISRAWIAASGPFSVFPGIDRTFLVTEGRGVELSPAGVPARLGPDAPPFAFAGDVATGCVLLDGPVIALNVMTARGRWRHRLERRPLAGRTSLAGTAPVTLAVLLRGAADLPGRDVRLTAADAVRLLPDEAVPVDAAAGTVLAWVELWDDR
ncbi:HutD family protein [Stella sp.]|uniref:HutD/Ves family protein n=1 Tax=Stella sp. TaxID=2912054 RepID=UPI0035B07A52